MKQYYIVVPEHRLEHYLNIIPRQHIISYGDRLKSYLPFVEAAVDDNNVSFTQCIDLRIITITAEAASFLKMKNSDIEVVDKDTLDAQGEIIKNPRPKL